MSVSASQFGHPTTLRRQQTAAPQAPPFGGPSWAAFYFLPPAFMAFPLAWYGAGMASEMSKLSSLVLWGAICLISWWLSDVLARTLAQLTPRRIVQPWILLTAGYLLNTAAASYYNPAVIQLMIYSGFANTSPMVEAFFAVDRNLLNPSYLYLLYVSSIPGLFCWLVGNYIFEKTSGVPRFSRPVVLPRVIPPVSAYDPIVHITPIDEVPATLTQTDVKAVSRPAFFDRLTRLKGLTTDELVAVEAEDHYIQVHSSRGTELIYFRFRDALAELAELDGLQIHRSAWVHLKNVRGLETEGRALFVRLGTENRLKVSLSNRGALLQAGIKPLN